jgi:glycosyltransferase involved in cell wall biosynthesis
MIRVALYPNICNNFFILANALRSKLNVDAHLYLNPEMDFQNKPESAAPELKDNYPEWIHMAPEWDASKFWTRLDKRFIKELSTYDLVFLSDIGPSLAPFIKTKCVFVTTGADVTKFPFPSRFPERFRSLKDRIVWEYIGLMQRRGIRACYKILTHPFYPYLDALKELKVDPSRISNNYFPFLMDTDAVQKRENAYDLISEENRLKLKAFRFLLFHPSRLMIQNSKKHVASGQWKANDLLFKGFSIFLKNNQVKDACLVLIDRTHNADTQMAIDIIKELEIEQNVVWLKPTSPDGFPRAELINYYSIADVVADDFGAGWWGSIVLEGMACSKPVICYTDEKAMKKLYPWHPILSSNVPSEIAGMIAKMYFDSGEKEKIGKVSRDWVEQYHSQKNGINLYYDNFKKEFGDLFS